MSCSPENSVNLGAILQVILLENDTKVSPIVSLEFDVAILKHGTSHIAPPKEAVADHVTLP